MEADGTLPFEQCSYKNCVLTTDKNELSSSDIVLFHGQNMYEKRRPSNKLPGQIWGYFIMEAPPYTHKVPRYFKNKFNWTLSYRRDSDVPVFYGEVEIQNRDDYRVNKTSSVSQLEMIIKSLQHG